MRAFAAFLISSVALVSFATASDAAESKRSKAMKSRAMYTKAPPMALPPPMWTGWYVGLHTGWGWGHSSSTQSVLQSNTKGWLYGVQLGTNYQFGRTVVGLEGEFSGTSILGNSAGMLGVTPVVGSTRHLWIASLSGRLGYDYFGTLAYFKTGPAWTRYKWDVNSATASASLSDTRFGWLFGVGLERAFGSNFSGKIEYNYLAFGSNAESFVTSGGLTLAPTSIRLDAHLIKLGLNYRFGGSPLMVRW